MATVMDAAHHMSPRSRSRFMQAVPDRLDGCGDLGDGDIERAISAVAGEMQALRAAWLSP